MLVIGPALIYPFVGMCMLPPCTGALKLLPAPMPTPGPILPPATMLPPAPILPPPPMPPPLPMPPPAQMPPPAHMPPLAHMPPPVHIPPSVHRLLPEPIPAAAPVLTPLAPMPLYPTLSLS
mmetsp:Transcript_30313/g.82950  ORF Transcript_30313/g.82950 Transcript_30313/m.82950 type:complete len:121 (+) Transcript_30313:919-1281(+)